MARMMKTYSIRLLSGIFFSLCVVMTINYVVDPYALFGVQTVEGVDRYKPEIERYTRLSKVYQVSRVRPETILLASSRGLVIPEDVISTHGEPASNIAIPSGSTYELLRMFQHALSTGRLERVILALDERFSGSIQANFVESRLAVTREGVANSERWKQQVKDYFNALLSFDALRSSIRTVIKQQEAPSVTGEQEYKRRRVVSAGGNRQLFRTLESSMLLDKTVLPNESCERREAERELQYVDYFREVVEQSYQHGIDLIIYFSPVHARYYEVKCMTGDWGNMEQMKREVVSIVERLAEIYQREPYRIFDFSGYNEITTESVPELGDVSTIMRWYYEGSHYTEETALQVFKRIQDEVEGYDTNDFGVRLSSDSIERHIERIRSDRVDYLGEHQTDIKELRALAR